MKKFLICLILIISWLTLNYSQEIDRSKWDRLTEDEKFKYYITAVNGMKEALDVSKGESVLNSNKSTRIETLTTDLEASTKELERRWYPVWGFGLSGMFGFNFKIENYIYKGMGIDSYIMLEIKRYFLKGRFFLEGGVGYKFYDDTGFIIKTGLGFSIKGRKD